MGRYTLCLNLSESRTRLRLGMNARGSSRLKGASWPGPILYPCTGSGSLGTKCEFLGGVKILVVGLLKAHGPLPEGSRGSGL